MVRIIVFLLVFGITVFILHTLFKYLRIYKFFKWLGKKIQEIKIPKINWKYYSLKRIRTRKQLDKLFKMGLLKGTKKFYPSKESDRDFNYENDGTFHQTIIYEVKYQIEFPNLSTINIIRISDGKHTKSLMSLKSGDIITTEPISNFKAKRYINYFKVKDHSFEDLKRTVDDVIQESERATYLNKLQEIDAFTKEIDNYEQ